MKNIFFFLAVIIFVNLLSSQYSATTSYNKLFNTATTNYSNGTTLQQHHIINCLTQKICWKKQIASDIKICRPLLQEV